MKNFVWSLVAFFSLVSFSTAVLAQEKKGGKKGNVVTQMVNGFLKQLEKAELTADQTAKIKEIFTKAATEVSNKRSEGGITADIMKKRLENGKAAKEAGKKGKDLVAAQNEGLSEAHQKLYQETELLLSKARVEIGKLLSAEQIAKLPEQVQNNLKERAAKGKKGKK